MRSTKCWRDKRGTSGPACRQPISLMLAPATAIPPVYWLPASSIRVRTCIWAEPRRVQLGLAPAGCSNSRASASALPCLCQWHYSHTVPYLADAWCSLCCNVRCAVSWASECAPWTMRLLSALQLWESDAGMPKILLKDPRHPAVAAVHVHSLMRQPAAPTQDSYLSGFQCRQGAARFPGRRCRRWG